MQKNFSKEAEAALKEARRWAQNTGQIYLGSEHLLLGLLSVEDSAAKILLSDAGIDFERAKEKLLHLSPSGGQILEDEIEFTPRAERILSASSASAKKGREAGTEHILLSILSDSDSLAVRLIALLGGEISHLLELCRKLIREEEELESPLPPRSEKTGGNLKALFKYGRELISEAKEGKIDPIIGREEEIDRVVQILSRRTKNNPCLVGEPGVGKTAIVEGLAQRISSGEVPQNLLSKKLFFLDLAAMVAGTKYRGEFEERIKNVIDEAIESGEVILFLDEIHTIVGAGASEGGMDASNLLKPALSRGKLRLLGATTLSEYRAIEKDAALERRFEAVMVSEPSEEEAVRILQGLRKKYEQHHKVLISDEALKSAVSFSVRYLPERYLPDKAIDLIDEAASKKRMEADRRSKSESNLQNQIDALEEEKKRALEREEYEKAGAILNQIRKKRGLLEGAEKEGILIGEEEIAEMITRKTKIPVLRLMQEEAERLMNLEAHLKEKVMGQNEAVEAVSRAVRRSRTGLKSPSRPMGIFLFCGPTGVGKTELARALSEVIFGSEKKMIRVDMSEFSEKHSVSKLIGSPPGYIGFEEGGALCEKMRKNPYSVVLFDEMEKAHPDIFNLLLQMMEDGHLTDSHGRRADFKNALVIMTSNCGAQNLSAKKAMGFSSGAEEKEAEREEKEKILKSLKERFRPEFLNRFDEILVFSRLGKKEILAICEKFLQEVKDRLREKGIELEFSKEAMEKMAEAGFDPEYGARPLRRAVQRRVEDPLAEAILRGKFQAGDRILAFLSEQGEIDFGKK